MSKQEKKFLRFSRFRRLEHWVNTTSFLTLGFTGLIQKFSQAPISLFFLEQLGGVEVVRIIHRVSAVILVLITVVHIGDAFYSWYVKRKPLSMLPGKEDITNAWGILLYNIGIRKEQPEQGFYTFEEKFEYWALIWGTVLMSATGFILWNPILANRLLPGAWIPAAKAAHGLEAILAVLAILIWHMYHVFIKHFNKSMYNGYMSREEMEHFHAKALEGPQYVPPSKDDDRFQNRRRSFTLVYSIFAVVMVATLVWLVTAEKTALATVPPVKDLREVIAYSPMQATPIPTLMPEEAADIGDTWYGGVGSFIQDWCAFCHKAEDGLGGLNLTTYDGALAGGNSGPAIRPGASGVSPMIIWPQREDHPVHLDPDQIAALRIWIDGGAPVGVQTETPTPEPTAAAPASAVSPENVTYENTMQEMFASSCGMCHGSSGGLDVSTYESLLTGGDSGPGIVPGDLDASVIYQVQASGEGHFGQLTEDQLSLLEAWILAGAPEN